MKKRILPILSLLVLLNGLSCLCFANGSGDKTPPAPAVTINTAHNFYGFPGDANAIDNNPAFDDDLTVGVAHMASLHIQDGGSINAVGLDMTFNVDGNVTIDAGTKPSPPAPKTGIFVTGSQYVGPSGGPYTLVGNITITAGGDINTFDGSVISSFGTSGGAITIIANGATSKIDIDGLVHSEGSLTGTGATQAPGGGPITIKATCLLTISSTGIVESVGHDPGADLVHLEACAVEIYGLVQSTGPGHAVPNSPINHLNNSNRPDKACNSTAGIEVWANTILIDNTGNNHGEVNADLCCGGGTQGASWIDLFARGTITINGKNEAYNNNANQHSNFAVHASMNDGTGGNGSVGGTINIKSTESSITASGLAVQADGFGGGGDGGLIVIEAKNNVNLTNASDVGATIFARGDNAPTYGNGGFIYVRSFSATIVWRNGVGNVTPTGNGIPIIANKGLITIQKCTPGVVDVTGTTFTVTNAPASSPVFAADNCVGSPSLPCATGWNPPTSPDKNPACPVLACNPYVVLPAANCTQACQPCPGAKLTIVKTLGVGTPLPLADWSFTTNIPGVPGGSFTIPKAGGSFSVNNVPTGSYTVTESQQVVNCPENLALPLAQQQKYGTTNTCSVSPNPQLTATFTVSNCEGSTCTFTNFAPACQPCPGAKLTIVKTLGVGTPLPLADWSFTTNIPGVPGGSFTIPKAGGSYSVNNVPTGNYTVTESQQVVNCPENLALPLAQQQKYGTTNTCSQGSAPQLTATFTVTNCDGNTCTFTNFAAECQHSCCVPVAGVQTDPFAYALFAYDELVFKGGNKSAGWGKISGDIGVNFCCNSSSGYALAFATSGYAEIADGYKAVAYNTRADATGSFYDLYTHIKNPSFAATIRHFDINYNIFPIIPAGSLPTLSFSPCAVNNNPSITVGGAGATFTSPHTFSPATYGNMRFNDNSVITLQAGTYLIRDVSIGKNVTIIVDNGTILNIQYGFTTNDGLKFGDGSHEGAHINVGACGFNVSTTRVTNFAHGSEIHGIYFAPTGWLDLGGGNNLYGHFVAQRITGDPNNNVFTCCDPVFPRTQRVDPGTIDLGFNVLVYQNPSKSDFQLEVHSGSEASVTIQVMDVSGRVVGKINNASRNIPVSVGGNFQVGVYFAEITQGTEKKIVRLVKID